MSGTEAAATLSLEINTGGAERKLSELATAYNALKESLSGNVPATGLGSVSEETAKLKKDLAALTSSSGGEIARLKTQIQDLTANTDRFKATAKDTSASVAASISGMAVKARVDIKDMGDTYKNVTTSIIAEKKKLAIGGLDFGSELKGQKLSAQATTDSIAGLARYISKLQEAKALMGSLNTPELVKQSYGSTVLSEISNLPAYQSKLAGLTASKVKASLDSKNRSIVDAMQTSTAELVAGMRKENAKRQTAEAEAIVSGWKDADASAKMVSADTSRIKEKLDSKNRAIVTTMQASTAELVAGMRKENAHRQKAEAEAIVSEWRDADASAKMVSTDAAKIKSRLDAQNNSIVAAMHASTAELIADMRKENAKRQKAEASILSASNKFLDGDAKVQARTTLVAAKRIDSGRDTSLMAPEAVSAAQSLGSTAAAQSALDGLTTSHAKAVPAVQAHTKATKAFAGAADEAHAFARGLSGSLGTLWMTYGSMVPLMAGAALAGGFMQAAKAGSEFAYQLTFVKALGGESAESVAQIGTAALNLSKTSMYGPVELANGLRILSQAGLSAKDSMLALPSAMQLATVGEMSMEQASVTLVGVMNAFGESLGALPHIGDMFAKAAAMSQTSVSGMSEAMKSASVVHDQYGASIEDTATAITLLAKVNITGTAAGTSYRNMLKDLYTPSKEAGKVLKQLGIETKDSMGNLREAPEIMFDLQSSLKEYTQGSQTDILGKIFSERGGKEAIQILNQTRESWDAMKNSIADSDGFMSNVTSELEMTTKGRFKQALNTMQSNLIEAFDASEGSVRGLADSLRSLADSPEFVSGIKAIVGAMATLATVIVDMLPVLIRFGEAWLVFKGISIAVAGISAVSAAMTGLGTSIGIVSSISAFAGGGVQGLTLGLAATSSAAAATAGATGLGAVGGALALLTNPISLAVVGVAGLGYALYQLVSQTPDSVKATQSFIDVLTRQNSKTSESIALLKEKNRLQREGTTGDANAIQAQLATLDKQIAIAKDKTYSKSTGLFDSVAAGRELGDLTRQRVEASRQLGIAEKNQAEMNSEGLVSVLQDTSEKVAKLKADAEHNGKKLDTSLIDGMIKNLSGQTMTPQGSRLLREEFGRLTDDLQMGARGIGKNTFVPIKDQKDPKASNRGELRDQRTILQDNLSSGLKQEQIQLARELIGIDTEVAAQTLSSIDATTKKNAATKASLEIERQWIQASLDDARVMGDKVQITKFANDLAENAEKILKQSEQATLDLTKARTADLNAIDATNLSTSRYLQDLTFERDSLGKTALEVANLRIEREKSRAMQDIDVKLDQKTITPEVAAAEKANLELKAQSRSADAAYQDSFIGGWNKAFDEYAKSASVAANTAKEAFSASTTFMEGAITQFVTTGKVSWKDLATSALASVTKTMASKAMSSFLGVATNFIGNMLSPGTAGTTSVGSNTTGGVANASTPWANGGVFSNLGSLHQYVNTVQTSPKYFAANAKGNVFAEAGPEAVMPLTRDSTGRLGVKSQGGTGSSGPMNVVINNNHSSSNVSAKEQVDSRGQRSLVVTVSELVAGEVRRAGSSMNGAVRQTFGASQTLVRR